MSDFPGVETDSLSEAQEQAVIDRCALALQMIPLSKEFEQEWNKKERSQHRRILEELREQQGNQLPEKICISRTDNSRLGFSARSSHLGIASSRGRTVAINADVPVARHRQVRGRQFQER